MGALVSRFKKSNNPFEVSVNSVLRPFFERNPFQKLKTVMTAIKSTQSMN